MTRKQARGPFQSDFRPLASGALRHRRVKAAPQRRPKLCSRAAPSGKRHFATAQRSQVETKKGVPSLLQRFDPAGVGFHQGPSPPFRPFDGLRDRKSGGPSGPNSEPQPPTLIPPNAAGAPRPQHSCCPTRAGPPRGRPLPASHATEGRTTAFALLLPWRGYRREHRGG